MYTLGADEVTALIGDKVPTGSVPAAWWITTDQAQLDAYDQWRADYDAHTKKIKTLAESIGLKSNDGLVWSGAGRSELIGFNAPYGMRSWPGADDYIPVPPGWRLDKKNDRLVPSRKTKVDRESQANKDFAAAKVIPNIGAYLTGLPREIYLDDRNWGGTVYYTMYRRGEHCVMAFSGADPDRCPEERRPAVDTTIWQRQKLSVLLAMRENG